VDRLVETGQQKSDEGQTTSEDDLDSHDNLVTINELIKAVQTSETTLDPSKVEAMIEVLGFFNEDSDGMIKVDHVMKVIELLSMGQHAKLPAKEIRQLVEMLSKEDLLKVEENIEQVMVKHAENKGDDSLQKDLHYFETAAKSTSGDETVKDKEIKNADISSTDEKYNIEDRAKDISEQKDAVPPHIEEIFSDKKNSSQQTKHVAEEEERKLAKVKLSDKH
jgi:Ca2+-binding EF-hand superfamily protein